MIQDNLDKLYLRIEESAKRSGREKSDIQLIAVSKRFPTERLLEAHKCGQIYFGENYIQEVKEKRPNLPDSAKIHFIGHLQTNKAKNAAETCEMIETVDRVKLANALNRHLQNSGQTLKVLVQVNIGDDPKKAGVRPEATEALLQELVKCTNLKVCGLMTMPPIVSNPEHSRPHFQGLRQLLEDLQRKGYFHDVPRPDLSMGMSNDFEIAIEEGATIIRVGTAIFGERPPKLH